MDESGQALVLSPQHQHYTMPASWSSNIFSPSARSTRPVCRHVFAFSARTDGIFAVSPSSRSLSPTSPSLPDYVRGHMPESLNGTVPIRVLESRTTPFTDIPFAKTTLSWDVGVAQAIRPVISTSALVGAGLSLRDIIPDAGLDTYVSLDTSVWGNPQPLQGSLQVGPKF